jgi:hypothetical protein
MLRITVLFIVVTLTGLPVLPAVCLTWCGQHRTTSGSCHDEAVKNGVPVVSAANDMCTALPADRTFIREDMRPVLHAVHTMPVFAPAEPLATAPTLASHHRGPIDVPPNRPLVLRV